MKATIRYVYEDVDRHGNVRRYFKRGRGPKIRMREDTGSDAFAARYADLLAGHLPPAAPDHARPKPGTLRSLLVDYLSSSDYMALRASTQIVRRQILEHCMREPVYPGAQETYADFPLNRLTPKAIKVLRDRKAATPAAARNRINALRALLAWGIDDEQLTSNPARDVKKIRWRSDGHHTWTIAEVDIFAKRHKAGSKARLALVLLLYTGARRSDVVLFGRQHIEDGWLRFRTVKSGGSIEVEIPILPALAAEISAIVHGGLTFLLTEYGKPFTAAGFGGWFRDRCDEAGLDHCSAHGLRKAGATIAANNGATAHQLMRIFGWTTIKQAEAYTRSADRRALSKSGIHLLVPRRAKNTS